MKKMGVLGGIGPQATMDFVRRVHLVSQASVPQFWGSGYPPMIVDYFREPPVLLDPEGRAVEPNQPNPAFLARAARVGPLVDFLVIASNSPHQFAPEIAAAAGRPLLSMIDVTLGELKRRRPELVGLMGLGRPRVYEQALAPAGIPFVLLDEAEQGRLDGMIRALMEGRSGSEGTRVALAAVESLRARGASDIILGCTEIPLLLGPNQEAPDLINPAQLLAEAALVYALPDP
jgi:aspartate racemase